jgi:putative tricarboxylic transport membrane protein
MSQTSRDDQPAASTRTVELVVAGLVFVFGAVVVFDSVRLGWGWASDGPQAGYFPFYIGLLICLASVVIGARALRNTALSASSR